MLLGVSALGFLDVAAFMLQLFGSPWTADHLDLRARLRSRPVYKQQRLDRSSGNFRPTPTESTSNDVNHAQRV